MKPVQDRTRKPLRASINGTRQILAVQGKEPGYVYRIVNDIGDRVASMQEQGYEIVTDKSIKVGDRRVAVPTAEGSPVQVTVSQTSGTKGIVMRIREDWYKEDQETKLQRVNELEAQTQRAENVPGRYGEIKLS